MDAVVFGGVAIIAVERPLSQERSINKRAESLFGAASLRVRAKASIRGSYSANEVVARVRAATAITLTVARRAPSSIVVNWKRQIGKGISYVKGDATMPRGRKRLGMRVRWRLTGCAAVPIDRHRAA